VIDSIEEFFQIEINHPAVALRNILLGLSHGMPDAYAGADAVAEAIEARPRRVPGHGA